MSKRTRAATGAIVVLGAAIAAIGMAQAKGGETFTATASVKSPKANASAPVTIHIDRFVTDAERAKIVAVVKAKDDGATVKALEALPDIGLVTVGDRKTPIKYAYARPVGDGRMVTVVTAKPVAFVGGADPGAKPKAGYHLAIALLVLDAGNKGDGEFAPAARIGVDANGAVVTEDYGSEVVRLTGITKVK